MPISILILRSVSPASIPTRGASTRRCTPLGRGPCASTRASARAAESNARYRELIAHGTAGLSVAFDLPTQMGYDSDAPIAAGEVGKVGVAIDSIEDMRELFAGIPLDQVSTSMTINAPAAVLLAAVPAGCRGAGRRSRRGSPEPIQNDVLKEYIARGTYIFPPAASLRLVSDTFAYCRDQLAAVEHDLDLGLPHG